MGIFFAICRKQMSSLWHYDFCTIKARLYSYLIFTFIVFMSWTLEDLHEVHEVTQSFDGR